MESLEEKAEYKQK